MSVDIMRRNGVGRFWTRMGLHYGGGIVHKIYLTINRLFIIFTTENYTLDVQVILTIRKQLPTQTVSSDRSNRLNHRLVLVIVKPLVVIRIRLANS
jgi:hypothetical protein